MNLEDGFTNVSSGSQRFPIFLEKVQIPLRDESTTNQYYWRHAKNVGGFVPIYILAVLQEKYGTITNFLS